MSSRYVNIQKIELSKLFDVKDCRLIREEHRKIPGGISEIPIKFDIKKDFTSKLNFKIPWDGEVYAFVKGKKKLFGTTGYDNTRKITISDWDSHFVIIFEDDKGNEEPIYSAEKSDVKYLLENCRRPQTLI